MSRKIAWFGNHGPDRSHDNLNNQMFDRKKDALAFAKKGEYWKVVRAEWPDAWSPPQTEIVEIGGPDIDAQIERVRQEEQARTMKRVGKSRALTLWRQRMKERHGPGGRMRNKLVKKVGDIPHFKSKILKRMWRDYFLTPDVDTLKMFLFDAADGLHWFCVDFHGGQNSKLYKVLSFMSNVLNYRPSSLADGPDGELAEEVYDELVKWGKKKPQSMRLEAERIADDIDKLYPED